MIIRELKKSILYTDINNIAHGVNYQNKMGMGVAKVLYTKYPKVKECYHKFMNSMYIDTSSDLLGTVNHVQVCGGLNVYNLFTQDDISYNGSVVINYAAIVNAFDRLLDLGVEELAIPRIGCGLAGGDWSVVSKLINDTVLYNMDITVYSV